VDGRFAEQTEAAVQQLQTDAGLAADGRVGPQTWAALRDAEAAAGILTAASDHASMAVGDLSEDQQWRWDGKQWEPAETNAALAFAPEQVADGHVSTDGHWRWDGSSWQPVG
jgi:lysozyme family protein